MRALCRRRPRRTWAGALGLTLALAGCGGGDSNGPGPSPLPPPPTLTCPADVEAPASQGQPPLVTYETPSAQNGAAPVSVTCAPASGTPFPLGDTVVTCTARDARSRTGTCSFTVTVTEVPQLRYTKFLAFGDSLTEGVTSPEPQMLHMHLPDAYPIKLEAMLAERYTDQDIEVINAGCAGEFVDDSSTNCEGGLTRLRSTLDRRRPDVLLLMHGANDLNNRRPLTETLEAIEKMIEAAHNRGVEVLVATLPPQNPDGEDGNGADLLPEFNSRLARMARNEGAVVVDLYGELGTWRGYVGADGLHMTPAGYQRVAEIWMEHIQDEFETQAGSASAPPLTRLRR